MVPCCHKQTRPGSLPGRVSVSSDVRIQLVASLPPGNCGTLFSVAFSNPVCV
jgi:hypothetical protein